MGHGEHGQSLRRHARRRESLRLSQRVGELMVLDGETVRTTSRTRTVSPMAGRLAPSCRTSISAAACSMISSTAGIRRFTCPTAAETIVPRAHCYSCSAIRTAGFFGSPSRSRDSVTHKSRLLAHIGANDGFVVQAAVKLATGDESMLAGSGSTDYSLNVVAPQVVAGAPPSRGLLLGRRRHTGRRARAHRVPFRAGSTRRSSAGAGSHGGDSASRRSSIITARSTTRRSKKLVRTRFR